MTLKNLIVPNQKQNTANKQCHKIAFYVQKIHKYEILKMEVNFMKDDDGKIWLFYIDNLLVRKIFTEPGYTKMQELDYMTKEGREQLDNEVKQYLGFKKQRKDEIMAVYPNLDQADKNEIDQRMHEDEYMEKMYGAMGSYYEKMREEYNLAPDNDTTIDSENDKAIGMLRPRTALKFKDWVKRHPKDSADPKKRQKRRKMSENKSKLVMIKDINVAKISLYDNLKQDKFKRKVLMNEALLTVKDTKVNMKEFFPKKKKIDKKLRPARMFRGVSNVDLGKLKENFIPNLKADNYIPRPKTANKSTQRMKNKDIDFVPMDMVFKTSAGNVGQMRNF